MPYLSKLVKRLALAFAIVVTLGACADATADGVTDPDGPLPGADSVASVRVMPESLEVRVGQARRFVAEPRNDRGQLMLAESVVWTSSDTAVATVDVNGNMIALRDGETEVRARVRGNKTGRSHVRATLEPVATVSASPAVASVQVGSGIALVARTASISDSTLDRPVRWTSSATTIASVDGTGYVSALSAGSAIISAESEGRVGIATITTTAPPSDPVPGTVSNLTVTTVADTTATLRFTEVGDGLGGAANYEIRYGTPTISWSSATAVIRGTCTSPLTGTGAGTVRTCVVRGLVPSTAYQFRVRAFRGTLGTNAVLGALSNVASATTNQVAIATITVAPGSSSAEPGQTRSFAATLRDAEGNVISGRTISWSSTSASVATVSSNGVATAVATGSTTIRASSGGRTGSAGFTVTAATLAPVASITVSPSSSSINVGATTGLTATLRDAAGTVLTGRSIVWSSTAQAVATVTQSGVVSGIAAGTASIRATSEGIVGSASVLVVAPPPPAGVWPELPSGWTTVMELDFEDKANGSTNYSPLVSKFSDGLRSITHNSLPTALIGPSGIGQSRALVWNYPANHQAGGSIELEAQLPANTKEAFVSFRAYISNNWISHGSGINKYLYFGGQTPSAGWAGMWVEWVGPTSPYSIMVVGQTHNLNGLFGPGSANQVAVGGAVPRGAWHRVSARYRMPTTDSSNDGQLRVWVNGILHISSNTVTGAGQGTSLNNITFSGILGGVGGMSNAAQAWAIDELIVAVP